MKSSSEFTPLQFTNVLALTDSGALGELTHGFSVQKSEFIIRLPVPSAAATAKMEKGQPANLLAKRLRILVVDDNADITTSLSMLLELKGHEVQTAGDGIEAIVAAGSFKPQVILMDIGMPRLNGYDAASKIRSHTWGVDIILIALTGWGQEQDRSQAQKSGFDHHITKPIQLEALKQLLCNISL